jgi:hypothetical protein
MHTHTRTNTRPIQGLLKEKLELERIKAPDGRSRVTLKPIDDQLTFDKVCLCAARVQLRARVWRC